MQTDPFATFAKLRDIGPIFKSKVPMLGEYWGTTTHEAADTVLRGKVSKRCDRAANAS